MDNKVVAPVGIEDHASFLRFCEVLKNSRRRRLRLVLESGVRVLPEALSDVLKSHATLQWVSIRALTTYNFFGRSIWNCLDGNAVLTHLAIRNVKMDLDGATVLAQSLKANRTLKTLWLARANITAPKLTILADALGVNNTLQELRVENSPFGDGVIALLSALVGNTVLRVLHIDHCVIMKLEYAEAIGDFLKKNKTLRVLSLQSSELCCEHVTCIADGLRYNTALASLDFGLNLIGGAGAATLADVLKTNTALTSLNLRGNIFLWHHEVMPHIKARLAMNQRKTVLLSSLQNVCAMAICKHGLATRDAKLPRLCRVAVREARVWLKQHSEYV